jgi:hypothetical protein
VHNTEDAARASLQDALNSTGFLYHYNSYTLSNTNILRELGEVSPEGRARSLRQTEIAMIVLGSLSGLFLLIALGVASTARAAAARRT